MRLRPSAFFYHRLYCQVLNKLASINCRASFPKEGYTTSKKSYMKHFRLLTAAALFALCPVVRGADTVFWTEGFDSQEALNKWTVNTETAPANEESKLWNLEATDYTDENPSSVTSLSVTIAPDDKMQTNLISPVIDCTGRSGLVVGFHGNEICSLYAAYGLNTCLYVKGVDDTDWFCFYNGRSTPMSMWGWDSFRYELPASFNGKKLQIRIEFACPVEYDNTYAKTLYYDDIYMAEKPAIEAVVSAAYPQTVKVNAPVPLSMDVFNNGSQTISNYTVSYSIDGGTPVSQSVTEPLESGATKNIVFNQPADLSEFGKAYTLKFTADVAGDADLSNNSLEMTSTNIITEVPYTPYMPNRNSTDYWERPTSSTNEAWTVYQDASIGRTYFSSTIYRNSDPQNAVLVSRPIYMEQGLIGTVAFKSWTSSSSIKGALEVYLSKDAEDESKWIKLADYSGISSAKTDYNSTFNVAESGVYYLLFKAVSPTSADRGNLYVDVYSVEEAPAYDLALREFKSPAATAPEYTEQETVTVNISNQGTSDASGAKIALRVDGKDAALEELPLIASGASVDYTFTTKVNLTGGSTGHTLSANIVWPEDMLSTNNSLDYKVLADLAEPPYEIDTYSNDFSKYWTWEDGNKDGLTFQIESVYGNDRVTYNPEGTTVETTDEYLYSRELKLKGGKTYRVSPRLIVDGEDELSPNNYHIVVGLYQLKDGKKELVQTIAEQDINYWVTHHFKVTVENSGNYYIGFHLTKDTPSNYYFRFNELAVVEAGDIDLKGDRISLSGTKISGIHKLMAKARVYNNGIDPISKFTVKFSSPTLGEVSQEFELENPLQTGNYTTVKFDKDLDLNITDTEQLTMEVSTEGDAVSDNNFAYIQVSRQAPLDVPATVDASDDNGWLVFDRNMDSKPEYYSWYDGFDFSVRKEGDVEQVYSPAMNLKGGKNYKFDLNYRGNYFPRVGGMLDVYLVNVADESRVKIAEIVAEENGYSYNTEAMTAYASVAEDGIYSLLYEDRAWPEADTSSYSRPDAIAGGFSVSEAETLPDMKLIALTVADNEGIYSENETVKLSYKNNGTVDLPRATFYLKAGDKVYNALVLDGVAAGDEGEVEFTGVDLYTPGEYLLKAGTGNGADAAPADNMLTLALTSNAIVEAAVISVDGPRSGDLGRHEHVVATIQNNGKGALTDFPLSYTLTREGGEPVTVTETVAGPVADGETMQYTFTADADFSVEGTYTLTVKIDLEGDTDSENNQATTKVNSTHSDMDAGVDKIVGPTDRLMTQEEYIVISVHNYGEADLYDVPVTAKVIRDEETLASVSGIVPEIPAGESVDYTFTTPVNLEKGGDYTIEAATALENDVDKSNDAFSGTIYSFMIDCGVDAIISPEANCPAGDQTITVRIRNFGDAPVSDIPVFFKLGNNPQMGNYAGTIEPGETAEYSFASTYKFREGRDYTLTAYTELPTDMNPDNDSCELAISPTSGINGVYADGISVKGAQGCILVSCDTAAQVTVYQPNGKAVASEAIVPGENTVYAGAGIYLVNVTTADNTVTVKTIVK